MELPEVFYEERAAGKVAHLRKALYGLKQSARCWSDEIKEKFKTMKMKQNLLDPCLWYHQDSKGEVLVYLHVDDMAITGDAISQLKEEVKLKWKMEDSGPAHKVVGIEFLRKKDGSYEISQPLMITSVVDRFRIMDCRPTSTPFPGGVKVFNSTEAESREMQQKNLPYRSVVGSLMYISICTRPDISYVVGVLSQHLDKPSLIHWNLATYVLR